MQNTEQYSSYYITLNLLIDSSLFISETGFNWPVNLEDAARNTLQFAIENPEVLSNVESIKEEEKLIELYYSKLESIHREFLSTN